jgi:DNA-binding PadR family transcriptional regulator
VALSVLSLLAERPMHPYEMKILMRERGHDRHVRLKGGSLYDTVERLQRLGFIEAGETNREGRRPERTVYSLTEAGRDELKTWLREMLSQPVADYPQFGAALAFISALEPEEWIPLLTRRAVALEADIAATEVLLGAVTHVPRIFLIEEEYGIAMRAAELEWVRDTIAEMKSGKLSWPSAEVLQALSQKSAGGMRME